MRQRLIAGVLTGIAILATPQHAGAWGGDGHRIVARIAYKLLPAKKAVAIDKLLRGSDVGVSFTEAAAYADDLIRAQDHQNEFGPWHYVNWTITEPYSDQFCQPTCIIKELSRQIALTRVLNDPDAKALTTSWIMHLIGDLHQPLHVGDNRDRGGNAFRVTCRGQSDCGPPSFPRAITFVLPHKVWDSCLVYELEAGRNWWQVADDIRAGLKTYHGHAVAAGDPESWAREAHDLAREVAYRNLNEGDDLDDDYIARTIPVIREQILRAGIRLAKVLDEIL